MTEEIYKKFFDQVHQLNENEEKSRTEKEFAGSFARIPQDVNSVLDIGCGVGIFLDRISSEYRKVGIDFCFEPLKKARHAVVNGRMDGLPFYSSVFDLTTCFEVLEHLRYDEFERAINEIERVSKKYIIISVPNRESLHQSLVVCRKCYCHYNPSWHVRSFNESSLRKLFRSFRLIELKACGSEALYHNSKFVNLFRHWIPRRPSSWSICPQCGYSDQLTSDLTSASHRNNPIATKNTRNLMLLSLRYIAGKLLIRYERRPYWLLALYESFQGKNTKKFR